MLMRNYGMTTWITTHPFYRGADKSLARPERKQATELRIYPTRSPRSWTHFLARCSNFSKPLKKKFRRLSVQKRLRGSNDKWLRTSQQPGVGTSIRKYPVSKEMVGHRNRPRQADRNAFASDGKQILLTKLDSSKDNLYIYTKNRPTGVSNFTLHPTS